MRARTAVDPRPVDEDGPAAVLHRPDFALSVATVRL